MRRQTLHKALSLLFLVIFCSVGETDWKAELEAFGKGVREDANEVQRHAHKAALEGASRLEHLPQQAANARFPRVDPDRVKTQFDQVVNRLPLAQYISV